MSALPSEELLRKAASWMAFKQGRELFAAGRILTCQRAESGWSGSVQTGRQPIRVRVLLRSASDWDVHCSCPENRASGAVCAHAVATGLACLAAAANPPAPASASQSGSPPPSGAKPRGMTQRAAAPAPETRRAWELHLPARWHEAFARGILSLRAQPCPTPADVTEADDALSRWLTENGLPRNAGPHHLHLRGEAVGPLLEILWDHPRAFFPDGRALADNRETLRLPIPEIHPPGQAACQLKPAAAQPWREIAGQFWRAGEKTLARLGTGPPPPSLRPALTALAAGQSAEVDCHDFLRHLPLWREWLEWPENAWIESLSFPIATPSLQLEADGHANSLRARLLACYPDHSLIPLSPANEVSPQPESGLALLSVPPFRPGTAPPPIPLRDLAAENRACGWLRAHGWNPEETLSGEPRWQLAGKAAIDSFLLACKTAAPVRQGIHLVPGAGLQALLEQTHVLRPRIEWDRSGGEGSQRMKLSFETNDGESCSLAELRSLLRGAGTKQAMSRRRIQVDPQIADVLLPLLGDLECHQESGWLEMDARASEVIREIQKKWFGNTKNEPNSTNFTEIPETVNAQLRSYQAEGFAWLVDRLSRHGGALLADDMGLGKTIQTIACIERLMSQKEGVALVVVPASLLGNWRAEWRRFAPARMLRWMHGAERDEERERVRDGDVVLTTYGTLARDLAWHLGRSYLAVVADEASLLRNPDTDHAKAMFRLKSGARIALTGTPIENRVADLWSVFRFVQPGWLGGREHFRETYEQPIATGLAGVCIDRLKLKISPFVLRRTKEQVARDLPAKWVMDEYCELSEDQREVYRALREEGLKLELEAGAAGGGAARMRMLTTLLRLRQACCDLALLGNDRLKQLPLARRSAKLERLMALLEEARDGGHRVLVFSQFRSQLLLVEEEMGRRGLDCLRLDGQTRDRQRLVERFQAEGGPLAFLISLKAGGYGLNLTAADVVVHMDPWWNPAAEAQATDRAHRIGQERPVTVYRLLTRGTVEEVVVGRQADKRAWAALVDEAGQGDPTGWTAAELAGLIRHDLGR